MCVESLNEQGKTSQLPAKNWDSRTGLSGSARPALVKAEANFLRFPLFALRTKGLQALDGIECRGRICQHGQTRDYLLRITRNTGCFYPGPLSRKVHFALLSIATERGFPFENPVVWTWHDLCRRMGISYGGQTTIRQLKAAIRAVHGIVIHTSEALYSRPDAKPLSMQERGYHLYTDFVFVNERLASGGVSEQNAVWFADWYLSNLNALFSAPLDYFLWQSLERQSPIASRLYEFLLLNFRGPSSVFCINYPTLAQLLPIHAEQYPSLARKQLEPACRLLIAAGLIDKVDWKTSKDGFIQLHFHRGKNLSDKWRQKTVALPAPSGVGGGSFQVQEIRTSKPIEWLLVSEFYRLWSGTAFAQPTSTELSLARAIVEEHGQTRARALIPLIVKRLKTAWPEAKCFGAVSKYIAEVARDLDRKQNQAKSEGERQQREEEDRNRKGHRREFVQQWIPTWQALPEQDRENIRSAVLGNWPYLKRVPAILERKCLEQLAQRPAELQPDR